MLVLARKEDESAVADLRFCGLGIIKITVIDIRGGKVRFGIDADAKIPVHRQEVFDAIERHRPAGEEEAT